MVFVYSTLRLIFCFYSNSAIFVAEIFVVWVSCCSNHCLAAPDLGAGVEHPFNCLITQNRQVVRSMRRTMDWTLEANMVDSLFFWATLTGRWGGNTPFVQAGAETSDTGAEAVEPVPVSSWEGHSGSECRCRDENTEPCGVVRPLRIPWVIRPERRM